MTDKEKIKLWAKGRLFEIMNGIGENDSKNILADLLSLIDSMQKEPVSIWHDTSEEPKPNMELICVGQYGNPLVLSSNSNSFKSRDISKWAYFNDLQNLSNVQRTVKDWKEKPISNDFEMALAEMIDKAQTSVVEPLVIAAQWKDELIKLAKSEEPVSEIDFEQELYKYFGQVKDFTLGMRIAKRFYEIGRNYQEPVSEDLEEAAREYAGIPKDSPHDLKYCVHDKKAKYNAVLYGANWKKQQMEAYRIEHCKSLTNEQAELEENFVSSHVEKNNRIPTFIDAIEYGMEYCKQQMMAKAVDVTIAIPYPNGYGGYTQLVDSKEALPFGENIKVLVIKED